MRLQQSYELYLRGGGREEFEALTCDERELVTRVRSLLEARELDSIEVRQNGRTLFTLAI